jgi:FkbM family methyltransferase
MISIIGKKIKTALRVYHEQGVGGIGKVFLEKAQLFLAAKRVELAHNQVIVDDCTFDVGNPTISSHIKALLWLNIYEAKERRLIKQFIDPNLPIIEIGGGIGVVSCVANRILNNPNEHVVVEANPTLIPILELNRSRNHAGYKIINAALAYNVDFINLYLEKDYVSSSVKRGSHQAITVPTISLKQILEKFEFEKATLICDIEGVEQDLVCNEASFLAASIAILIIEMHDDILGKDITSQIVTKLHEIGFKKLDEAEKVMVFRNNHTVL